MRLFFSLLVTGALAGQAPMEPARIRFFRADPPAVAAGGTVTLSWSATGVDTVRLEPLGQEFPAQGQVNQVIQAQATFWLHANNAYGGQDAPLVVNLDTAPALPVRPAPPAALPQAAPAAPQSGFWIQFGAFADPGNATKLSADLRRLAAVEVTVDPLPMAGRPTLQRLRLGPFPSRAAALARLRQIHPRIRSLKLRPIVQ
jgi:cell division protein FtsN